MTQEEKVKTKKKKKVTTPKTDDVVLEKAEDYPTDERKGIMELFDEGKVIRTKQDEDFIIVHNKPVGIGQYTKSGNYPEYKLFIKDIDKITVNFYYDDLKLLTPKKLNCVINVAHRGFRRCDKITLKQYKALVKAKLITANMITYTHIDSSRCLLVKRGDSSAPSIEQVDEAMMQSLKDYKTQHGRYPDYIDEKELNKSITNDTDSDEDDDVAIENDEDEQEELE